MKITILLEGSCRDFAQNERQFDQVCLNSEGDLDGTVAGSNHQRAFANASIECEIGTGETGLIQTGNAEGTGAVTTPNESWNFQSTIDEKNYEYRNSTAGASSLFVDSLVSNGTGLIWYVFGNEEI